MTDQFRIEVDKQDVLYALQQAQLYVRDLTPLMKEIEGILVDAAQRAFKEEQDPETGVPWAALSPVTIARRGSGATKLQDTSNLVQSISSNHDATSATVGVSEKYGITHQLGTKKGEYLKATDGGPVPWGDIPARPFLGIGKSDQNEILDAVSRYISISFQ